MDTTIGHQTSCNDQASKETSGRYAMDDGWLFWIPMKRVATFRNYMFAICVYMYNYSLYIYDT